MIPNTKCKGGFTLIEVLVAATIIALLTSIGVVSYQAANRQARDAKRKADLEQIRAALQIYRGDCGSYPASISFGGSLTGSCTGSTVTYMQQVPQDPKSSTWNYSYSSSGTSYVLCAYLEGGSVSTNCTGSCSCGADPCNYKLCPP
ncbi:prepilin-type N-terminal cleavage/methylation domain-containing protein [Candidatus Shapirobacteria bacterium]|nr:prepilin-type N-terminal cleavage/methylation domain-containing protein [Candidatus Shapirobacteria bacterium]